MSNHRTFRTSRRVRVGDCDSSGVIRIDALARYLQDIGYDDTDDLGVGDGGLWVARSISMDFSDRWPQRNEIVSLETYCGGVGRAFAQRNVSIASQDATIEASTIWVSISEDGKPMQLPSWLLEAYPTAQRVSSSRLLSTTVPDAADSIEWHFRASDFDVNDHANNAVAFDALYELAHTLGARHPRRVIVEYYQPIEDKHRAQIMYTNEDESCDAWLVSHGQCAAAMRWEYA